uniref:Uncharacterized protein n=1 Tax=Rhizophora mucronata TaxID=61149 RepID=A0A2P2NCD9_RHIMU
MTLCYTLQDCH